MSKRYSLEMIVVVVLFAVYALCAVFLCVIGADVYRGTADSMSTNYDDRTSVLYVAEKIRQNDSSDSIRVDEAYGSDAIVLTENISGSGYQTWVFVKDGILYEGLFAPDASVDVEICQRIMPMQEMVVSRDPGKTQLLNISFTTVDGGTQDFDLWTRSSGSGGA